MTKGLHRGVTTNRARALVAAVPVALAFFIAMIIAPTSMLLAFRSPITLFALILVEALAISVVIVELFRVSPHLDDWSDTRHFRWVAIIFAFVFIFQYIGLRAAMESHAP